MAYHVQIVSSAFSEPIPEKLWKTVSSWNGQFSALSAAKSQEDWYSPPGSGSWSGHVRIIDENGSEYVRNHDRCHSPLTTTNHAWCGWCLGTDEPYLKLRMNKMDQESEVK